MKKIILKQVEDKLSIAVSLSEAYPNPVNNESIIQFSVSTKQNIKLELFNELGASVRLLEAGDFEAGEYQTKVNPSGNIEKQLIPKTHFAKGKDLKKYDLNLLPGMYQVVINVGDYYVKKLTVTVVK